MAASAEVDVRTVTLEPQFALVVCCDVTPAQISETLMHAYPAVFEAAARLGLQPSGMPFMRYLEIRDDSFAIAAGAPMLGGNATEGAIVTDVEDGLEVQGLDVQPHILPGGRILTASHFGDYGEVGPVWDAVWAAAERHGVTVRAGGWDVYANDPSEVPPEEVETQLFLPLG